MNSKLKGVYVMNASVVTITNLEGGHKYKRVIERHKGVSGFSQTSIGSQW